MAKSINPATNLLIKEYQDYDDSQVDSIIQKVQDAQTHWKLKSVQERSVFARKLGEILLQKKEMLATLCSEEMGKLSSEAIAEVEKCASACSYYSENSAKFLQDEHIQTEGRASFISYQPLGVVLAVMPWNFPYWQVIRFAVPALCAGNGAILKHASNVSGCALALEEMFKAAGLPDHLFRTILIPGKDVKRVILHPYIKAVTLTGSTKAGKEVAGQAGSVLKKTVLELGGSDAYLILKDADLPEAAKLLVKGRMLNAGQSCISPKRLIVDQIVYQEFSALVEKELRAFQSKLGPMARGDLRDELQAQVEKSVHQGARCLSGGKIPGGPGYFYPPTLLVDVKPGMTAFEEEMFGPVVCLISARNETEAIAIANQSEYGLGAGIFSQNTDNALKIAVLGLDAGGVFINDYLKSDPRLPFGGIKESGHGRELSHLGIREFTNAKTIYLK